MSVAVLAFHAFWIPFCELVEVSAGWWFHYTYDDRLSLTNGVMVANLVWLIAASLYLVLKRVAAVFAYWKTPEEDVTTYFSIVRRFSKSKAVLQQEDKDREEATRAMLNLKLIWVAPQWISWVLSTANVVIIGIAHLEEGITAASATSQVPSWYIMCWSIWAAWKLSRAKFTEKEDQRTPLSPTE